MNHKSKSQKVHHGVKPPSSTKKKPIKTPIQETGKTQKIPIIIGDGIKVPILETGEILKIPILQPCGTSKYLHRIAPLTYETARMLLRDIIRIFSKQKCDKMRSKEIMAALRALPNTPWNTSPNGRKLSYICLAAFMQAFGHDSIDIKFGRSAHKGYHKEWFIEVRQFLKTHKPT